jgi:hypothetical protein
MITSLNLEKGEDQIPFPSGLVRLRFSPASHNRNDWL